jgi:hypothetical protein
MGTNLRRPPQPGDFGIKPGGGLAMWLVRLGTFSPYGHAAEVVDPVDAPVWFEVPEPPSPEHIVPIIEAAPGGVRFAWVRIEEFRWSTGGPLDLALTIEARRDLSRRAWAQLGRGYDWPSIAHFLFRFFGAKVGHSHDHPDDHLICSELIVWNRRETALQHGIGALDMFPDTAPGDVSPGQLQDWCPRSPGGKP